MIPLCIFKMSTPPSRSPATLLRRGGGQKGRAKRTKNTPALNTRGPSHPSLPPRPNSTRRREGGGGREKERLPRCVCVFVFSCVAVVIGSLYRADSAGGLMRGPFFWLPYQILTRYKARTPEYVLAISSVLQLFGGGGCLLKILTSY